MRFSLPISWKGLIGFWGILLLVSCEGNTRLEWSLDNQSTAQLVVVHEAWDYSNIPADTLVVLPGEVYILGANDVLGGNPTPWAPSSFIDTLFIFTDNGDLCAKDWQLTENWTIVSEELKRRPSNWEHTYVFSVNDGDF